MNTEFKGTQAPWEIDINDRNYGLCIKNNNNDLICVPSGLSPLTEVDCWHNTYLIAAAPELLEALLKTREMIAVKDGKATLITSPEFVSEIIESAINKALNK